jgi:hypothetical protein
MQTHTCVWPTKDAWMTFAWTELARVMAVNQCLCSKQP